MLGLRRSNVIVREGRPQPVSAQLRGKQIERLLSTPAQLLIRCTDGTEVRMSWRDEHGAMIGTPCLDDVRSWR
ncbi:MAG: hypothetical protein H0W33_03530 [Gammaproteobacteria bacterium]|nr:hypothetical protein [Gammaproteobacteria bacterium]